HIHSFDKAGTVCRDKTILPATRQADADPITREFFDYYRTRRGYHPRSVNSAGSWSVTTPMPFMNFAQLEHLKEISPRPVLIIT
ncbi:alpha/beta hydrolase, partial [Klebsiella quasipneumoniae]